MDSLFLQNIQKLVEKWRADGYKGVHKETENILTHIKRVSFLHGPQIEALETYIFLKEVIGNKPSVEIFKNSFPNEIDFMQGLGLTDKETLALMRDAKKEEKIQASFEIKI
jgi:phosphomevalonate kinase